MKIRKDETRLLASPRAVITLFLSLPGNERTRNVHSQDRKVGCGRSECPLSKGNSPISVTVTATSKRFFLDHYNKVAAGYPESLDHLSKNAKTAARCFFYEGI
jgi:hypothetical protein